MMDYDFSGWATKNDILCEDRRIIRKNAFKDCDGKTVPLVFNHSHDNLDNVLGHALLENRDDGVYCYCFIDKETSAGKQALSLVKHGSINSLSIYANKLKQVGQEVIHGVIREVSLVLAGANRGAVIDNILAHAEDASDENGEAFVIYAGEENPIEHGAFMDDENEEEYIEHADKESEESEEDDFDLESVVKSMNEDQKRAMLIMMGMAADEAEKKNDEASKSKDKEVSHSAITSESEEQTEEQQENSEEDLTHSEEASTEETTEQIEESEESEDDENEESEENNETSEETNEEDNSDNTTEEENNEMKHNMFETESENKETTLKHSAEEMCSAIMGDALKYGSLKESFMAHSQDYGIENIDLLFPDAKNYTTKPEFIKRRTEWVNDVLTGVRPSPFARVKSVFADITEDEARAKGYIKGNRKAEEVFTLLKRETSPTTVYKKQKIDRDDIIDITDFDVIAYIKEEMRLMYDEEVARAILVGDGRNPLSPDKIKEANIRPIWKDDDLFTIKKAIAITNSTTDQTRAKTLIKQIIKSRKLYKGSGSPTLFITEDLLSDMLLIEDTTGRLIYDDISKLKNVLRVSKIVEVPIFDGLNRIDGTDTKYLAAILVNLNDYRTGRDKGGALAFFDDFDIDFNQQKYLMESRFSGALVVPYSAIVYEFVYNLTLDVQAEEPSTVVLGKSVSDLQENVYVNDTSIMGTLNYVTDYTGFSGDPDLQQGFYLALKYEASEGATVSIQTIGGVDDSRVVTLDSDMNSVTYVKSNKQKLRVTCELNGETITKTLSFSGLKLVR